MSQTTRTRRTADQWRRLIAEQAESGMSQEAFCKHNRLALSTFANWKRRLGSQANAQEQGTAPPSTWIDLGSPGARNAAWDIELDLGDGICLRLRRG